MTAVRQANFEAQGFRTGNTFESELQGTSLGIERPIRGTGDSRLAYLENHETGLPGCSLSWMTLDAYNCKKNNKQTKTSKGTLDGNFRI